MKELEKEDLKDRRVQKILTRIAMYKKDMAERLSASKKNFESKVYAVDIHCHSNYSDGLGTPVENYECAKNAGLDFLFITDHNSIKQKHEIKKPDKCAGLCQLSNCFFTVSMLYISC